MHDSSRVTLTHVVSLQGELQRAAAEAEELRELLTVDPQTQLGSKWAYVRRCGPMDGHRLGHNVFVVFCDLNGFKTAQDAHPDGHVHGNRILEEFSEFVRDAIRHDDPEAYRTGGDEFVIRCSNQNAARRIRDMVRIWRSEVDLVVTCAAGLGPDYATADANCYFNKRERKNDTHPGKWTARIWQGLLGRPGGWPLRARRRRAC